MLGVFTFTMLDLLKTGLYSHHNQPVLRKEPFMANIPSFNTIIEEIDDLVEGVISRMTKTLGKECGLDSRCGTLWVSDECIAINKNSKRSFEYYGGLEYVNREDVVELGDYVIYSSDAQRINSMINYYEVNHGVIVEKDEESEA